MKVNPTAANTQPPVGENWMRPSVNQIRVLNRQRQTLDDDIEEALWKASREREQCRQELAKLRWWVPVLRRLAWGATACFAVVFLLMILQGIRA